ncbi:MAG: hypothetical protein IPP83_00470 [Flavobacteriales bacterium]|nr:hypothetical protein [Flavobacteriales bacterium]
MMRANEVHNAAVLVMDVETGEVLAYMGNQPDADADHAGMVDVVRAQRSTGSLLKPFLYADMLQSGERMPDQLVADLPTSYEGFAPRNYDERFDGAVPASQALSRSLNVPAVRALREHGVERTRRMFLAMGLVGLDRGADHYGLSLIVGGGESSLWELTGAYASLARIAIGYSGKCRLGGRCCSSAGGPARRTYVARTACTQCGFGLPYHPSHARGEPARDRIRLAAIRRERTDRVEDRHQLRPSRCVGDRVHRPVRRRRLDRQRQW